MCVDVATRCFFASVSIRVFRSTCVWYNTNDLALDQLPEQEASQIRHKRKLSDRRGRKGRKESREKRGEGEKERESERWKEERDGRGRRNRKKGNGENGALRTLCLFFASIIFTTQSTRDSYLLQ